MKTKNRLLLLTLTTVALSLGTSMSSAQVFDPIEPLRNRAIAASPRAREVFPWLARTMDSRVALVEMSASKSFQNASLTSPRMLEQFPELARSALVSKGNYSLVPTSIAKNRAFASSPRAQEEFPWLRQQRFEISTESFQIAPLK